ncbi:MAG: GNAT family N-acetyltransferase [Parasporobacterium sp.]|nr:GNAT family N-acetyltransferase [Parasporobacterium sp.]
MLSIKQFESQFHPVTLEDLDWIRSLEAACELTISDQTFGISFVGSATYQTQVAGLLGSIVYRYEEAGILYFSYPLGPDPVPAAEEILHYMKHCERPAYMSPIDFNGRKQLLAMDRDDLLVSPGRDYFDYLYRTEDLRELKGKRYASKRNHIHRFTENGEWSYEPLDRENFADCLATLKDWHDRKSQADDDPDLLDEYDMESLEIHKALNNLDDLGFWGGVIRREGQVIAFSVCEELNPDTMVVHFEKARADIQGAFQIINRETAAHADPRYLYVNREDDLGIPGLRQAKESYHPFCLRRKYTAQISDVVFANENDLSDIVTLWQEAFGDEENYIREYLGFCTVENALGETWLNETILAIRRDRRVVSMGSFLEGFVTGLPDRDNSDATSPIPVRYAYAVATALSHRNQGLFTRLMNFARDFYNCPIILRPETESLKDLYSSLGFVDASAYKLTLTDQLFLRSGGDIIDEPDYTEGLMILF